MPEGCVVRVDLLRSARLAVVGLETTTGQPAVIVAVTVYRLTGGMITGARFSYWTAPDVRLAEVPVRCWPYLRLAPPWVEVAPRLLDAIDQRTVVVHAPGRLDLLRRHLPDWQPAGVLFTRHLAEQEWPGLDDYGLDALTLLVSDHQLARVGPGATAEAQATALLLGALLTRTPAVPTGHLSRRRGRS
jgi:hypothetical protein